MEPQFSLPSPWSTLPQFPCPTLHSRLGPDTASQPSGGQPGSLPPPGPCARPVCPMGRQQHTAPLGSRGQPPSGGVSLGSTPWSPLLWGAEQVPQPPVGGAPALGGSTRQDGPHTSLPKLLGLLGTPLSTPPCSCAFVRGSPLSPTVPTATTACLTVTAIMALTVPAAVGISLPACLLQT